MPTQGDVELLSVDSRPIRNIGNSIGQSFDIDALRELGVVDEDGELVDEDLSARQIITDDGTIEIELDVDELDADQAGHRVAGD